MKTLALIFLMFFFNNQPGKILKFDKAVEKASITSNDTFKKLMQEKNHSDHFQIPSVLLNFTENFAPFRFSFANSADYNEEKLVLTWFFSEYAMEGDNDDVSKKIKEHLISLDFTEKKMESDFSMKFEKEGKDFKTVFIFDDLVNYEGGSGEKCGATLIFYIEFNKAVQKVSINEAINAIPSLKFKEFPEKVYKFISSLNFETISYGGTWTQYYTWSTTIPYNSKEKLETEQKTICSQLEESGFELVEKETNNLTYRSTEHTGSSWFYISINENKLELRFQPNS